MKKIKKILFLLTIFAILFLIGNFLFGHFQQNLTPSFGITHAQDLHTDLSPGPSSQTWIFTVWKVALALANVIVIVMLLFVAVVNIVHLQYDTYAIKKSLPLLIIGIIMANFSLLICRMIVDSAQVLTNTFASNPKELATGLLCSMGVVTNGSSLAIEMIPGVVETGLIIMIFVFILILIAVFILAFLLWIRKTVIFLLVAVAPVAFIMYAFPPTQQLFKQWWGWFLKWTFMGPIVMLLVWVASVIGKTNCDAVTNVSGTTFSISALFATCGVLYLAAIVPFKLGGPVMGAWGGLGKKSASLAGKAATQNPWSKAKSAETMRALKNRFNDSKVGQSILNAQGRETKAKAVYDEDKAISQGRALDTYNMRKGKPTTYEARAREALQGKRVKEDYASYDLENGEELAQAFRQARINGDHEGMIGLTKIAASNGMISDVQRSATSEEKIKFGNGLLDENGNFKDDVDSQKEFARRLIMDTSKSGHQSGDWEKGTDDLRARQQINNSMVKAGHFGAQTIVADENNPQGFRELDLNNANDKATHIRMTQGRLSSGHAQKFWQTIRKEALFNSNGTISENGKMILEALPPETVKMVSRARSNVLQRFNTPGNVEILKAAGLNNIGAELEKMGAGAPAAHGQVVVSIDGSIQPKNISDLQQNEITPEIQKQIVSKITDGYMPGATIKIIDPHNPNQEIEVDAISHIANQVNLSPHFDDAYKAHVRGLSALKQQQIRVRQLTTGNPDAATTQQIVNQASDTIQAEIGNALQNGIEISPIVHEIISEANGPVKAQLMHQIHDSIANSQATIITPQGGQPLHANDVVSAYEAAKPHKNEKLTNFQVQENFVSALQAGAGVQLSAQDMDRAWRLVETYLGKAPTKKNSNNQNNASPTSVDLNTSIVDEDEN